MKFTRVAIVYGGWPNYVSGDYVVRKTEHNKFFDMWSAFFKGERIGQATHMKHAKAVCEEHAKAAVPSPSTLETP